jgi:hypothetical protein
MGKVMAKELKYPTPKSLMDKFDLWLIAFKKSEDGMPVLLTFLDFAQLTKKQWNKYCAIEEYGVVTDTIRQKLELMFVDEMVNGGRKDAVMIFLSKNHFGYSDNAAVVQGKDGAIIVPQVTINLKTREK